jgi:hypothetical protein
MAGMDVAQFCEAKRDFLKEIRDLRNLNSEGLLFKDNGAQE